MVLEKWMYPDLFAGTEAEDEDDLARMLPREQLVERLDRHRATYITAEDFQYIASLGLNTVRVPVPHFIFDERPPTMAASARWTTPLSGRRRRD